METSLQKGNEAKRRENGGGLEDDVHKARKDESKHTGVEKKWRNNINARNAEYLCTSTENTHFVAKVSQEEK